MDPIVVSVGQQSDGCVFGLAPKTRVKLAQTAPAVSPIPSLFVAWTTKDDFEAFVGPIWLHVAAMLTGIPEQYFSTFKQKVVFVESVTNEHLFTPCQDHCDVLK
jgi:hypothetical protein